VFLGKEQVSMANLQERVRQKMETSTNKEVFLRGDSSVQYQDLMNVIDALKAAGVQNIGMVARMPSER
jgi:biopolymer transport protein ExbD